MIRDITHSHIYVKYICTAPKIYFDSFSRRSFHSIYFANSNQIGL